MSGIAEHAIPAYVPEAQGRPTHFVCYDYPKHSSDPVTTSIEAPCMGLAEAHRFAAANKKLGMCNVRILSWEEKHGLPVQLPQAVRS